MQAVPATLKRYGLSQIINHLLSLGRAAHDWGLLLPMQGGAAALPQHAACCLLHSTILPLHAQHRMLCLSTAPLAFSLCADPPRPFDFVVGGELLRKSLEAHLLQHGLSAESLLEVEYVPAVPPPKHQQAIPHDDW